MPHIHLFTSADLIENVDIPDILRGLVEELSAQETIDPAAVKAYHSLHHTWSMGQGAAAGFAFCQVSLLGGRTAVVRNRIADAMFARMQKAFRESILAGEVIPNVEVREMDAETYRK